MSLSTLFDRTVELELTTSSAEDARGNETRSSSSIADVPCYRGQLSAAEDTDDRDQQARTFVYYFPPTFGAFDLGNLLSGRDRIVDGDETLEILGAPIVATSRGRARHVEARAFLVDG